MSDFLPYDHPRLGQLAIETVFEYYDAPVLFSARNELGFPFLGLAVDEIEGNAHYLFVPMSETRLIAVRTGLVTLRDAFGQPETPIVFLVRLMPDHEPAVVNEVAREAIRPEWLPYEGEALGEALETASRFSLTELGRTATRENRHLMGIEVEPPQTVLRTELPLRFSGPIMTEFQELADSLSNDSDFALVQLQAASFVIVVAPLVGEGRLFGSPSPAVGQLVNLLGAAATDAFGDYLPQLSRRTKAHVRDFLAVLSDAGTGVTLSSASPAGTVEQTAVSLERVRTSLQLLRSSSDLDSETLHLTGYLMALNHAKRTFGLKESTATGGRKKPRGFSGKFDPAIYIEGIASGQSILYQFTILRESQAADFDDSEIKYSHRMLEMSLLSEQGQIAESER